MSGPGKAGEELEALRALVREHQVVFDLRVVEEMVGSERRKVGFDVALCGTDPSDDAIAVVGSEGARLWRDLQSIALAILPPPGGHSVLGLRAFDQSVHSTPLRNNRDDIELVIGIRHEMGALDPIDAGEEQTMKSVVAALRALGVPEGKWRPPPSTGG